MTELVNPSANVVTVWSDTTCPWGTLALHTLRTRAHAQGRDLLVDHRAFPLELFNSGPTPKLILDAELVAIAGIAPDYGWRQWRAPDYTYPVTTLPALEAVQAAKAPTIGGLRGSDELDTALRHAFYVDNRCISIHSVILDLAKSCDHVDEDALADALARGTGRPAVYEQWKVAQGPEVQGSPHLFTAAGFAEHNPGITFHWTTRPPIGFPRVDDHNPDWADNLLNTLP
ncbi:DsbA family oxidoreductase [Actinokineospora inagensis]|uniref:DsbA family oxidoreductase n=1 Tax=Actinokineospora inagensis TaxID=103730 RepID=UPI00040630D1|nr:dithiol-disulfide isomerase [Actinokineospora inagensis]